MSNHGALSATKICACARMPGSVSSEPAGTATIPRSGGWPGHLAAAARAKRHRVETRIGHLVFGHERRAAHPAELVELVEGVGGVRRRAAEAAAAAVAVHHARRLSRDLVADAAAQATALGDSSARRHHRPGHALGIEAGRVGLVLRQSVGNAVPRRLGTDENMALGLDAEIAFQACCRRESDAVFGQRRRAGRAAHAAESSHPVRRGLIAHQPLLARDPAKTRRRRDDESGEAGAVVLAAHRAVAVDHRAERPIQLIAQRTAQASSLGHSPLLAPGGYWRSVQD